MSTKHKDLEFHVEAPERGDGAKVFRTFKDAAEAALVLSMTHGKVHIDVVTWSRGAALAWGGESAAEIYDEDPDASVHERIEVSARSWGKVS